jgi:flagellar biosynthesis/type III secretory pathway M-ring protein FliF/YscJ
MITLSKIGEVSPIFLTVLLIIYLMIVELGNRRTRNALMPLVVILAIAFMILAVISVYTTYVNLK